MFKNLASLAVILAVAYWYWTGPYQDKHAPKSYQQKLVANGEKMMQCERGLGYQQGAGNQIAGSPETLCAKRFNFYQDLGQWHSYDDVRPDGE